MLTNVLNSLYVHTYICIYIYRAYTRNRGHVCNIDQKRKKNGEKRGVLTKKDANWIF